MDLLKRIHNIKKQKVEHKEMTLCFQKCFVGMNGDKVLNYLVNLTLNRTMPASISKNELMHIEGQRYIVKLVLNHIYQD